MEKISQTQLLEQMRSLAEQAGVQSKPSANIAPSESFGKLFLDAVSTVNSMQKESNKMREAFVLGDPSVSLPQAMIAGQKASVSFQMLTEVRNKFVTAYQEIMNMSL